MFAFVVFLNGCYLHRNNLTRYLFIIVHILFIVICFDSLFLACHNFLHTYGNIEILLTLMYELVFDIFVLCWRI